MVVARIADTVTEQEWYVKHNCTHAHCIDECEHPQPYMDDEALLCGRCAALCGVRSEMMPCVPGDCVDDH